MKRLTLISTVISAVLCLTGSVNAVTATINIQAYIDGRDQLIISGDTLQWHHFDFAAVGRHDGRNEPTIISTQLDGSVMMDKVNWIPDWPEPPPAEIRYEAVSSIFTDLIPNVPPLGGIISDVDLIPIRCRGSMSLIEFDAGHIVIEFNDDPPLSGGYSDWYEAQINVTMTPEPATICLLGLGGLTLLRRKR